MRSSEVAFDRFRPPRAFGHAAWWSALALLLLNDHAWKGAGLLPAALTGKLSDLAGMVVAPPLVALLLGAGDPRARRIGSALVGFGFAAIKLSPAVAAAVDGALALAGLPSRIWVDPTDLVALALLPLGHALSRPAPSAPPPGRERRWARQAGVVLAAIACIATTGKDDKQAGGGEGPQLENQTGEGLVVVLASTEGAGGCSLYRDDRVSALTPDAFVAARELVLDPEERVALASGEDGARCGAAALHLPDGSSAWLFWRDLEPIESFAPADDERRIARRVTITGEARDYDFEIGDDLTEFEPGAEPPPEPTCPDPEVAHTLEFTTLSRAQGFFELDDVRSGDDGCLEIDWFDLQADTTPDTQRLCVPEWAFPFEPGAQVSIVQELDPAGSRALRITLRTGDEVDTQLTLWNDAVEFDDSRVRALRAIDCVGAVTSCGAYTRPIEVAVRGIDQPLLPGEDATVGGSGSSATRVLIGPARDVGWSAPACTGAEARPGRSANVLELRTR